MPIYDRSAKELMKEWAKKSLVPGQIFSKKDAVDWFRDNYPKIKPNTVSIHVDCFATNNGRHRSHHNGVRANNGWDLFFKEGADKYRLWDPNTDPAPVYDLDHESSQIGRSDEGEDWDSEDLKDRIDDTLLGEAREFAYEKDLQNFLAKDISIIEPGLRLYEDEGLLGIEYSAGGRRIDILAIDSQDQFVVIELKASKAYDRVVGQVARYMAWVRDNMETDRPVRGIIIANKISEDLKLASSLISNISLMEYRLNFEVSKL